MHSCELSKRWRDRVVDVRLTISGPVRSPSKNVFFIVSSSVEGDPHVQQTFIAPTNSTTFSAFSCVYLYLLFHFLLPPLLLHLLFSPIFSSLLPAATTPSLSFFHSLLPTSTTSLPFYQHQPSWFWEPSAESPISITPHLTVTRQG